MAVKGYKVEDNGISGRSDLRLLVANMAKELSREI